MLPAINAPVILYLILFGFARLTGGKNASVFMYEGFSFRQVASLYLFPCCTVSQISVVIGGGVSGRWWGGGLVLRFSSFLRGACLSWVTVVN